MPRGFGKHRGAFGHHRLALVDFRHRAAEPPEALLDVAQYSFVRVELAAEQVGDGFARAVVVGGAEAAARDDHIRAVERVRNDARMSSERIADHGFVNYANAQLVQRAVRKRELVSSRSGVSSSEPMAMISAFMAGASR